MIITTTFAHSVAVLILLTIFSITLITITVVLTIGTERIAAQRVVFAAATGFSPFVFVGFGIVPTTHWIDIGNNFIRRSSATDCKLKNLTLNEKKFIKNV